VTIALPPESVIAKTQGNLAGELARAMAIAEVVAYAAPTEM